MDDQDRFAELQLLLTQARHHVQNAENADLVMERKLRMKLEQQLADEKRKRDEMVEEQVQLREKTNPNQSNLVRKQTASNSSIHKIILQSKNQLCISARAHCHHLEVLYADTDEEILKYKIANHFVHRNQQSDTFSDKIL